MEGEDPTHGELVERLGKVAVVATAIGADSTRAKLMTWHRWLNHPSFNTVVALAESGADGMVIADLPKKIAHVLQRNRYTSRTRKGEIIQGYWIESTST